MKMILHNLKVAFRNLMKYKLQTLISVLSIAVGIVTLSFSHSILQRYRLPPVFDEPYAKRTYAVFFKPVSEQAKEKALKARQMFSSLEDGAYTKTKIDIEILRALKGNGGLRNAEKIAVPNFLMPSLRSEFHLTDSTIRSGSLNGKILDPEYPDYAGLRSAITGKKIRRLKKGEAIISEEAARTIFGDKDPIGAVQTITDMWQPMPITIVDVFKSTPILETQFNNKDYYYCIADSVEEDFPWQCTHTLWVNIVLKEGAGKADLQKEIDARVAPLGYKAELQLIYDNPQYRKVMPLRILIHILGSLILLAAIIGFLRIEIQLFHIRRREMALRIANGATRFQLFGCLATEIAAVIILAMVASLILGVMLQDFIDTKLEYFSDTTELQVGGLWIISLYTGIALLVICSLIAWFILNRISSRRNGIASDMRRKSSNLFRNSMLCIQMTICIVFVSGALILFKGGNLILKANNVPANDAEMSQYLYLRPSDSEDANRLIDEISVLPDIDRMIAFGISYTAISELADNPEINEKINSRQEYYKFYDTTDTVTLSALGLDVKWLGKDIDRNFCFLLSEKTYSKFRELGILDNPTLTQKYNGLALPVGGIVRSMPYDSDGEFIIKIYKDEERFDGEYIIIPKPGQYKSLAASIDNTIKRVAPQNINPIIYNFRDRQNIFPGLVEAVRSAGWILGIVSLLICSMSIFSTIALDTRARKKEIAIRKVNGAKSRDIYRMMGRVYVVMIAISVSHILCPSYGIYPGSWLRLPCVSQS
ncbi:MAG: ABC transporter permease, partial [Muribaculaceae bacterium]|nr:ABC transporter permease [Muribaculaceae bacterium]